MGSKFLALLVFGEVHYLVNSSNLLNGLSDRDDKFGERFTTKETSDVFDWEKLLDAESSQPPIVPIRKIGKPSKKSAVNNVIIKGSAKGTKKEVSAGSATPIGSSSKGSFALLDIRPRKRFDAPGLGIVNVQNVIYDQAEDSRVFRGSVSGREVAIKVQYGKTADSFKEIEKETEILSALAGAKGVVALLASPPSVFISAKGKTFKYCVLEMLGKSLQHVVFEEYPRGDMPIADIEAIALKGLQAIEEVHDAGYVHGDIGLGNLLFTDSIDDSIKLIDFGYARKFLDREGNHLPPGGDNSLPKGARTALLSISEIDGHFPSRKDDLHRFGEALLKLLNTDYARLLDRSKDIRKTKLEVIPSLCCREDATRLDEFLEIVRGMGYESEPDYRKLKQIFTN